jgi:hypothetical protein
MAQNKRKPAGYKGVDVLLDWPPFPTYTDIVIIFRQETRLNILVSYCNALAHHQAFSELVKTETTLATSAKLNELATKPKKKIEGQTPGPERTQIPSDQLCTTRGSCR